jgi:hypothetical protein
MAMSRQPYRARIRAAIPLVLDAELPRSTMSFVDSVPVPGTRPR